MGQKRCSLVTICRDFKPQLLMVLVELGFSLLYLITKASFNHRMSPYVYVTYRQIVALVVMFPFAYFLERYIYISLQKMKSKTTLDICSFCRNFCAFFARSSLTLNIHSASLKYTNTTFVVAMLTTIPTLTFIIAETLRRFEVLDLRNPRGLAKVLGTLISLACTLTMTLYKEFVMTNLWPPLINIPGKSAGINESWIKGSLLTVSSCVTWSIWYIMQVSS